MSGRGGETDERKREREMDTWENERGTRGKEKDRDTKTE